MKFLLSIPKNWESVRLGEVYSNTINDVAFEKKVHQNILKVFSNSILVIWGKNIQKMGN